MRWHPFYRILHWLLIEFRQIRRDLFGLQQNPGVTPADDLRHTGKIVLPGHGSNSIAPVVRLVRDAVFETDHRRDHMSRRNVRDIETFLDSGWPAHKKTTPK